MSICVHNLNEGSAGDLVCGYCRLIPHVDRPYLIYIPGTTVDTIRPRVQIPLEPSAIGQWHMVRQTELIEGASGCKGNYQEP
jgi:hypothetical protein